MITARCIKCGGDSGYNEKGWWIFKKKICADCGKKYKETYRYNENLKWKTTYSLYNGYNNKKLK